MNRLAFTLAEVLITIGIIGIIATMTLPTLLQKKTNRELETALQKNYAILQTALEKASYDYGERLTPSNAYYRKLKNILMEQLKTAKDCQYTKCIPPGKEENENGEVIDYVYNNYKTFNKKHTVQTYYFDDGQFLLNDGTLYMLENSYIVNSSIYITIDINGMSKKPNSWGHDLFTFQITENGKLLPMGAKGTDFDSNDYCSTTSSNRINGIGCTYKALTEKNYWKKL